MSTEIWELKKDLCRCCHSEGNFKNLAAPCIYLETAEIYSDMLKGCFEIEMVPVPGMLCAATYTICEGCILRLRDAAEFKNQVQSCEERFKDLFSRNVFKVAESCIDVEVKQESPDTCGDDVFKEEWSQDDDDDGYIESFNFTIDEQEPVKEESNTKKKKLKSKKTSKVYSETVPPVKEETEDLSENGGQKKDNRRSSKRRLWPSAPRKKRIMRKRPASRSSSHENLPDNIELTATDLNASPDITADDNIASDIIPDADVNKAKNAKTNRRTTARKSENTSSYFRSEIQGDGSLMYQCTACEKIYKSPYTTVKHYRLVHLKQPYISCQSQQTSSYYTIETQEDGTTMFKCTSCEKAYKLSYGAVKHYRIIHLKQPYLSSCEYCDYRCPLHLKAFHLEEKHDIPAPTCNICGKKFYWPSKLLAHQRYFHMGERDACCNICGLKFKEPTKLRRHMIKHSSVRMHKCEICKKAFKWKNNLQAHIMMHNDDRRHVCPICKDAFVQRASLTYHITKRHPQFV